MNPPVSFFAMVPLLVAPTLAIADDGAELQAVESVSELTDSAIDANWTALTAVTVEDITSRCSGFAEDGTITQATTRGKWRLSGNTMTMEATLTAGESSKVVLLEMSSLQQAGSVLIGDGNGALYATEDCGGVAMSWDDAVVQVVAEPGEAPAVSRVVEVLHAHDAALVLLPGVSLNREGEGTEILVRDPALHQQTAEQLQAALIDAGFAPVKIRDWASAPAPLVVNVGG